MGKTKGTALSQGWGLCDFVHLSLAGGKEYVLFFEGRRQRLKLKGDREGPQGLPRPLLLGKSDAKQVCAGVLISGQGHRWSTPLIKRVITGLDKKTDASSAQWFPITPT